MTRDPRIRFLPMPIFVQRRARSVLCLPLINHGKLLGILYLENNLTRQVFTPDRCHGLDGACVASINLAGEFATCIAISQIAKRRSGGLVDANVIGIFFWDLEGRIVGANDAFLRIFDYGREDLVSGRLRWTDLTPAEWRERRRERLRQTTEDDRRPLQPYEMEYFPERWQPRACPDGRGALRRAAGTRASPSCSI